MGLFIRIPKNRPAFVRVKHELYACSKPTMRIVKSIWLFYKKLVIPALSVSAAIASIASINSGRFSFTGLAFSYIFVTPVFHYFIYEIRNPHEYYFYYNMGLSKPVLWISTFILSSFLGLILILIWAIYMLTA